MARKEKQIQVLTNEKSIKTTAEGWDKKEVSKLPVLMAGWQPGQASHHPINLGVSVACVEKIPEIYVGDFAAENDEGEEVLVPVVDPIKLNELMIEAFCEKYEIEPATLKIATNRGVKKKMDALTATIESMDPKMYAKLKEQGFI